MTTPVDELYTVTDGVDDVVADDHNTLVEAVQYVYDAFGGAYNFGNGRDGNMKLGSITNPVATNVATISLGGTGLLTGTFLYKYSAYNLTGETLPTNGSSSVVASNNKINVSVPAQASATNITGYKIYRSGDGGTTYYYVGRLNVDDPTAINIFTDNFPIASGTAPSGSNTTSTSVTAGGVFYCKDFTMNGTDTVTVDHTTMGFIVISNGNITIASGATINGDNRANTGTGITSLNACNKVSGFRLSGITMTSNNTPAGTNIVGDIITNPYMGVTSGFSNNGSNTTGAHPVFTAPYSVDAFLSNSQDWFNGQGAANSQTTRGPSNPDNPGASVCLIAKDTLTISGTINCNAALQQTTSSRGGAAGGLIYLVGGKINRTGATLSANGAAATAGTSTFPTSGGGGGGVIFFITEYLWGSATSTVNGGAGAGGNGSGLGYSSMGASFGGRGGYPINGGAAGSAGSAGQIFTKTPSEVRLLRF